MLGGILVCERADLSGAYACEHVHVHKGSTQAGEVALCLECLVLVDRGDQVVGEGFWLKQSPHGWQRINFAKQKSKSAGA